ncbi:MAG: hypothetical protein GX117_01540 [Candidatus Hydrogenedentes bacterium]|nr:hypothetical protein [Candidatus Hydrogenedentota bacterium]
MQAFRLAHEMGADWFELDCQLTSDGEVVILHDSSLERTTGEASGVREHPLAFVKALDAGSWKGAAFAGERIPTLAESLDLAKNTIGVYVEIKNIQDDGPLMQQILSDMAGVPAVTPADEQKIMAAIEASGTRNLELTRKTIALIRERNMEKEVVIQSFSPIICAITKIEAPEIRIEGLAGVKVDDPATWEQVLRWLYLFDLDGMNISHDTMTAGRMATIKASGKTIAVWTIDDPETMQVAINLGADAIITNCPDRALTLLNR